MFNLSLWPIMICFYVINIEVDLDIAQVIICFQQLLLLENVIGKNNN